MIKLEKSQRVGILFLICFSCLFISAGIAARLTIPKLIEERCSALLGTRVHVEKAGINFLSASFWLRGLEIENFEDFKETTFLKLERMSLNLSFTSLLARQLIFEKIHLKNLMINIEKDEKGKTNLNKFHDVLESRFFPRIHLGKKHFFTGYEIHQFAIKNGTFDYFDPHTTVGRKKWMLYNLDFSFSKFTYPPQIIDPIPTSIFFSAKVDGVREGSVLVLGSGNFFAGRKSFKFRSDLKNIMVRDLNGLFPDFTLQMTDGFLDLKSNLTATDDFLQIVNTGTVSELKLGEKTSKQKSKTVFGYPKKDVIDLFQNMAGRPFHFDFKVSSDLNDPKVNLEALLKKEFQSTIELQLRRAFERYSETFGQVIYEVPKQPKKPETSLKQAFEQWTGIKLSH